MVKSHLHRPTYPIEDTPFTYNPLAPASIIVKTSIKCADCPRWLNIWDVAVREGTDLVCSSCYSKRVEKRKAERFEKRIEKIEEINKEIDERRKAKANPHT